MGNACGCGSEKPIDPTPKQDPEEDKRQEELAQALAGMNVEPIDIEKELRDGELNSVKEVDSQDQ